MMHVLGVVRAWLDQSTLYELSGCRQGGEDGRGMENVLYGLLQQELPVTFALDTSGAWFVEGDWKHVDDVRRLLEYYASCFSNGEPADTFPILSKSILTQTDRSLHQSDIVDGNELDGDLLSEVETLISPVLTNNFHESKVNLSGASFVPHVIKEECQDTVVPNKLNGKSCSKRKKGTAPRRRKRPCTEVKPSYLPCDEAVDTDLLPVEENNESDPEENEEFKNDGIAKVNENSGKNAKKAVRGPYKKRSKEDPDYHLNLDGTPKKKRGRPAKSQDPNGPEMWPCSVCDFKTPVKHRLKEHTERKHAAKAHNCPMCPKTYGILRDLQRHMQSHTDVYQCEKCGKSYRCANALAYHAKSHEPDYVKSPVPCDQCDKTFSTTNALKLHIKTIHLNLRNFLCNYCGKAFAQKRGLIEHENVHRGTKPYVCKICGMAFHFSSSYKDHLLTHDDTQTWTCKVCEKVFKARGSLKTHMAIHTSQNKFKCDECPKSFYQKAACLRHMRTHTGERPYPCHVCKLRFSDSGILRRHLIGVHKLNSVPGRRGPKHGYDVDKEEVPIKPDSPTVVSSTENLSVITDPVAAAAAAAAITDCPDLSQQTDVYVVSQADEKFGMAAGNDLVSSATQVFQNIPNHRSQDVLSLHPLNPSSALQVIDIHGQRSVEDRPNIAVSDNLLNNHIIMDNGATHQGPDTSAGENQDIFNFINIHNQMYSLQESSVEPSRSGMYRIPASMPYVVPSAICSAQSQTTYLPSPASHAQPNHILPVADAISRPTIYNSTNFNN